MTTKTGVKPKTGKAMQAMFEASKEPMFAKGRERGIEEAALLVERMCAEKWIDVDKMAAAIRALKVK